MYLICGLQGDRYLDAIRTTIKPYANECLMTSSICKFVYVIIWQLLGTLAASASYFHWKRVGNTGPDCEINKISPTSDIHCLIRRSHLILLAFFSIYKYLE